MVGGGSIIAVLMKQLPFCASILYVTVCFETQLLFYTSSCARYARFATFRHRRI